MGIKLREITKRESKMVDKSKKHVELIENMNYIVNLMNEIVMLDDYHEDFKVFVYGSRTDIKNIREKLIARSKRKKLFA